MLAIVIIKEERRQIMEEGLGIVIWLFLEARRIREVMLLISRENKCFESDFHHHNKD